jgi:hypothetical protein
MRKPKKKKQANSEFNKGACELVAANQESSEPKKFNSARARRTAIKTILA